ncbi:MAG: ribulose-phosphate 3-epimerase, partial [Endomicrobium sp.]|nr:ribulose-phosphate 3-epimerase [Endomicrobium sp.]
MKKIIIAPSILASDFAFLKRNIRMIEDSEAEWIHIDVMDGHFVPNITIGPSVVKSLKSVTSTELLFDVHLMLTNPEMYWLEFKNAGANIITFHNEISLINKKKLIDDIKSSGVKVGVSIKPETPVSDIEYIIPYVDLVSIMTVEPGFSGQNFINKMICKISSLRKIIDDNNYDCFI